MSIIGAGAHPSDSAIAAESPLDETLPYAYGKPPNTGQIKLHPEDFTVDEILAAPLSQDGEHCYLRIEKVGENTEHVAQRLARFADVPLLSIGYAGLKDRQAQTRQWFSVGLAGKPEPDWSAFASSTIRIVDTARHRQKLRRGDLRGNRFRITVRSFTGPTEAIEERLTLIERHGVPNYFGPQRFGHQGANLKSAEEWLLGRRHVRSRHHRSLYLSAARSYLFNRILARRVENGSWHRLLPGDVLMGDSDDRPTRRWPEPAALAEQLAALTLHPAGTLWGRGEPLPAGEALANEQSALSGCEALCRGLEKAGLQRAMRALRVAVTELSWQFTDPTALELGFVLAPGAYATSVLREVFVSPLP